MRWIPLNKDRKTMPQNPGQRLQQALARALANMPLAEMRQMPAVCHEWVQG
jgi:hypothetical protein